MNTLTEDAELILRNASIMLDGSSNTQTELEKQKLDLAVYQLEMDALKVKAMDALLSKLSDFGTDFTHQLHNTLHDAINRLH